MTRSSGHIPLRTCISCGGKRRKGDLVRLVLDNQGRVLRDDKGHARGRGAYVCRSSLCFEKLRRGDCLNRAFKKKGPLQIHEDLWLSEY